MATIGSPAPSAMRPRRDWFLTAMAILFAVLAFSDFTKPFQHHNDPHLGLVVFGHRLATFGENAIGGPIFGIILAIYAYGLIAQKRWLKPLSVVYAFYVPVNLTLFWSLHDNGHPTVGFIIVYLILSVGGSVGTALYIGYHQDRLA
ncbi:MAG TPA: hypothetical protein VMV13_10945 [Candidatus Binataceae bacterium]|nr:hypothetical protein [Candidatus Binataceae bacterium]HVA67666.1 hypothetical protein [Candidatus Binataceae bacterium]